MTAELENFCHIFSHAKLLAFSDFVVDEDMLCLPLQNGTYKKIIPLITMNGLVYTNFLLENMVELGKCKLMFSSDAWEIGKLLRNIFNFLCTLHGNRNGINF